MTLTGVCPLTTADVLWRAATTVPELEAVVTARERITYAELAGEVAAIRAALTAAGVGRGDHVGVCLGNGPRWVALFLAIGSVGAVTVPVNTRFRSEELAQVLHRSRVGTLFVADRLLRIDFIDMLRGICPAVDGALPDPALPDLGSVVVVGTDVPAGARSWGEFMAAGTDAADPTCAPADTLLIQYTSGTTSAPKGVLLRHDSMCANAFFSGARMGLRPGDRFFSARPFFHVAGTTLSILSSLQHMATLVTLERFQAGDALRIMARERCTHFSGNDTIALMLLNQPERPRLSLRGAWLAASPSIVKRTIDELGARECVVGYGLSEASPNVAQSCWWESEEIRSSGRMLPQPGLEVRLRDPQTEAPCARGETGEILVRGWNVMRGYHDDPEATAAVLGDDGWLATGDLGRLDETGRLEFVGRAKELIRVGGENVAPAEVEDVLHRHADVLQAAVVGVPDDRLMEVPFAFVVLGEPGRVEPDELIAWSREHMAGFKVPRYLHVVESFEDIGMTASAKVLKQSLAAYARQLLNR